MREDPFYRPCLQDGRNDLGLAAALQAAPQILTGRLDAAGRQRRFIAGFCLTSGKWNNDRKLSIVDRRHQQDLAGSRQPI